MLAIAFGAISFVASRLLGPKRASAAKEAPYECGIIPSRDLPERFPVSFYLVAMLFIMFDIEIIFLYPYAVSAASSARSGSGPSSFQRRVLPLLRVRGGQGRSGLGPAAPGRAGSTRTSCRPIGRQTTIRRVGLEGRGEEAA